MKITRQRTAETPMKRHGTIAIEVAVVLLGFLLLAGYGVVLAGEPTWKENLPFRLTGEVEAGLQVVQPRGNSPTFDEYRDLDRTDAGGWGHLFQVPSLHLLGEDKARTRFLEIGGTNLSRMDANYYMNAGLYNYLRFNFEFDRIPHVIAHNAQTIYLETSPGIFRIPGGTLAGPGLTLANALNAVGTTPSVAQRNAVQAAVNNLLRSTELGFQTDAARFGFSWLPLPELELSAGYSYTTRDGHTPWGSVIGSPGGNVVELAAPRDERFHEAKFGAEYVRDWYQVRFNYTFSLFENEVDRIEWDNPCGAGSGGCRNSSGFGRFSTMPENYAHTFSGAAGFNLPWWRTRLTGGFGYSLWRQDETFLPWGTVAPTGGPFSGTIGNFTTDTGATSPDAKNDIINANVNLTTRPLRDVTVTARYRYFDFDNKTPEHTFTNVLSGGGDTGLTVNPTTPSVHTNEPMSFKKQNAGADVSWRIIRQVTAKVGYEYEHWNRSHTREVASSDEHAVKGSVDVRPLSWLLARLSYSHGVRSIGANGYVPLGGNAAAFVSPLPQFRKFDEADRTRDKGEVFLQVTPLDTLTLSGSFYGQKDNYFNTSFGLQEAKAFGYSADVSWAPLERFSVFAGYAHDDYKSDEQSCAVSATPPSPLSVCNAVNTFFVQPRDLLDVVHTGFTVAVIPKRLDVSFGYQFALGRSKQGTAGVPGFAAAPGAADPGNPADVPTTENKFHIFNVVTRYSLTPQWTMKLGYQYERYEEKDFTTDGIGPSLANLPLPSGVASPATADVRSIILGAQHPNYEAHIVALTLAYKF